MTRIKARELAIQIIFAVSNSGVDNEEMLKQILDPEYFSTLSEENELYSEFPDETQKKYIEKLVKTTLAHQDQIDALIDENSHGWRISRISGTALAVLRAAFCEILFFDDIPNAATISSAVEIDKSYDTAETVSFVNGVLGGYMKSKSEEKPVEE